MYKLQSVPIDGRPILSAQVGDSGDIFRDVARLYFRDGYRIADLTYGRGVFWRNIDTTKYKFVRCDISRMRGVCLQSNGTKLPFVNNSFDVLIFDPPYLYVGGLRTLKDSINRGYRNKERGFSGIDAVDGMYFSFLDNATRVLRSGGLAITKSMSQVYSGRIEPQTVNILNYAQKNGFRLLDWFVIVAKTVPTMRHTYQQHSRRNYSDFLILENMR